MLRKICLLAVAIEGCAAFAPSLPAPSASLRLRSASHGMSSLRMVNEDRMDGFGGGKDAIKKVIEKRSKDDWGEGYGGSKGELHQGSSSFAEYMAARAAEQGGAVTDLAGNDISEVKPSYTIAEGTWGPPEGVKEDDPLEWIDKSVTGFGKVDTSDWAVSEEQNEWKKKKDEEKAQQADEVEARMQKWLADAAAKKAAGQ